MNSRVTTNSVVLLEKDLRKVLIKKGLPPELADICHAVSNKFSGFVANCLFFNNTTYINRPESYLREKRYEDFIPNIVHHIDKLFKDPETPILPVKPNELSFDEANILLSELRYIKDWTNDPNRNDKSDIKKLSWDEAVSKATLYHTEKAANASNDSLSIKSGEKVVVKFSDGSYWLNLNKSYCEEEGNAMGHCGNANSGILYSLRDQNGKPHITAEISVSESTAYQIFGKANSKPAKKYHEKILKLLGELKITKVLVQTHEGESLNIEEDISDELKEWFEEEYEYYPTLGGITEEELKAGQKKINDSIENYTHASCWISEEAEEGEHLSVHTFTDVTIPYFSDFWKTLPGKTLLKELKTSLSYKGVDGMNETKVRFYFETMYLNITDSNIFDKDVDKVIESLEEFEKDTAEIVETFFDNLATNDLESVIPGYTDGDPIPKEWHDIIIRLKSFRNLKTVLQNKDDRFYAEWKFGNPLTLNLERFMYGARYNAERIKSPSSIKERLINHISKYLRNYNSDSLHNRENDYYVFHPLTEKQIEQIIDHMHINVSNNRSQEDLKVSISFPVSDKGLDFDDWNRIASENFFSKIIDIIEESIKITTLESKSFKKFFYSYY